MKPAFALLFVLALLAGCAGGNARVNSDGHGVGGKVSGTLWRF